MLVRLKFFGIERGKPTEVLRMLELSCIPFLWGSAAVLAWQHNWMWVSICVVMSVVAVLDLRWDYRRDRQAYLESQHKPEEH